MTPAISNEHSQDLRLVRSESVVELCCGYRKHKSDHSGDEVRQGLGAHFFHHVPWSDTRTGPFWSRLQHSATYQNELFLDALERWINDRIAAIESIHSCAE
jgi:hypothetical protein